MKTLSAVEFEKVSLDKWSHAMKKDNEIPNGYSSCVISILQFHGCIHQEMVVLPIYPSFKYDPINATLAKRLHVPSKHTLSIEVDGEYGNF